MDVARAEPVATVIKPNAIHDVPAAIPSMQLEMWQLAPDEQTWSISQARFGKLVLLRGEMAAAYAATGAAERLSLFVQIGGAANWTINGRAVETGRPAIFGTGAEVDAATSGACVWLAVQVEESDLEPYLSYAEADAPLLSGIGTRIATPSAEVLSELTSAALALVDNAVTSPQPAIDGRALATLHHHLLSTLALCLHGESSALRSGHTALVRRALDYLQGHDKQIVHLADLCAATQTSERWLREAFEKVYGLSPMRLLRLRRMNLARRALMAGGERSVTDVAVTHGFFDLGRFALQYRQLFGQTPSTTLRVGKSLHQNG